MTADAAATDRRYSAPVHPLAYLFERFPSFGQTFCYREVAELERQEGEVAIHSIRQPVDEPAQPWDPSIVRRVRYVPAEAELVKQIDRAARAGELPPAAVRTLKEWGRQSDFLRLYQAAYVGMRLKTDGVERVHAHFAGMAARTAYWISKFFGIAFSFTAHANDIFAPRDFAISVEKLMDEAVAIVTVSDFSAGLLKQAYPQQAGKIHRVYNGVDLAAFPAAEPPTGVPLIISVGRLIEKKGFRDLVAACAVLKSRGVDFRCEIVGDGPLQGDLSVQIEQAALQEKVELVGPKSQSEIAARFARATVFALPCTTETGGGMDNLPTVIIEAMAAGLPVISTPVAGVPEMVEPGRTGELVPANDPAALAAAIERLVSDLPTARALGARGRALAREKFAIAGNVRVLAGILRSR